MVSKIDMRGIKPDGECPFLEIDSVQCAETQCRNFPAQYICMCTTQKNLVGVQKIVVGYKP